jgi:4-hydroxy-tetrahydrodipicolinate synthase
MPACQTTDVLQAVWDKLEAGDEGGARAMFNRVLPLISYERQYGVALYKEVMYRRGVIATRVCRAPGRELDEWDRLELDAILADVAPLMEIYTP